MKIEEQLSAIKSKSELKAWIDELPEGVQGIILAYELTDGTADTVWFRELGDISDSDTNFLIDTYKLWLLQKALQC